MAQLVTRADLNRCDASGAARSLTQAEVGLLLGISRGRVYQLETSAIAKIRRAIQCEAKAAGQSVRDWLFGSE